MRSRSKSPAILFVLSATFVVLYVLAYLHAPKRAVLGDATSNASTAQCVPAQLGVPDPILPVPAVPAAGAVVGTSSGDIFQLTNDNGVTSRIDTYMAAAQKLGTHIVRVDLKWSDVQATCGSPYDWGNYSYLFGSAAAHNLWVQVIVDSPPAWAVVGCTTPTWTCAPTDTKAFVAFARSAVTTFGRQIAVVEVLNEPSGMQGYFNNVSRYAQLLSDTYVAVKSAAARQGLNITVEPGGTAAIGRSGSNAGMTPTDWYKALYAAGAKPVMDRITLHPYVFPETIADHNSNSQWAQLAAVQRVMAANGDTGKLIDITEMGWPTAGGKSAPATTRQPKWTPDQPVTEELQALFFNDFFTAVAPMHTQNTIGRVFVYSLIDNPTAGNASTEAHFGLLDANGNPKPAWQVVAQWANNLD